MRGNPTAGRMQSSVTRLSGFGKPAGMPGGGDGFGAFERRGDLSVLPGLCGADLSKDQQAKLLDTMRRMLECFRPDDVAATMKTIEDKKIVERLFISC